MRKGIIDSVTETMLLSSYHVTYTRDNREIMRVQPSKSDWSLKIYDWSIDIRELLALDLVYEFEFGRESGWYLTELKNVNSADLERAFEAALQTPPVEYLIQFPLTIIEAFHLKNPWLFQKYDQSVIEEVLEAYWKGNIAVIKSLSHSTESRSAVDIHSFIDRWQGLSSKNRQSLNAAKCHTRMKVKQETFLLQLGTLVKMVNQQLDKFKKAQNDIWSDTELMENKERFYERIEQARETILLTGKFIQDLETLYENVDKEEPDEILPAVPEIKAVEPAVPVPEKRVQVLKKPASTQKEYVYTGKVEKETDDWFEYLINSRGSSIQEIPFQSKLDVLGTGYHREIGVHEARLHMLAEKISKDRQMIDVFKTVIRLMIENTNQKGYISKEELRQLFLKDYEKEINQNILSGSKMSTTFTLVMEHLRKSKLIKEFYQENTYRIFWNFGCHIHT
ncbi:hypothetical protein [Domibacillus enclensis]|uniref:hypothetical protein n=1 Tax=Domibacillus enclensis TaxID=1017273 RepID=UPI0011156702|nr:hypothetical protein [Domibacillus enclensis]